MRFICLIAKSCLLTGLISLLPLQTTGAQEPALPVPSLDTQVFTKDEVWRRPAEVEWVLLSGCGGGGGGSHSREVPPTPLPPGRAPAPKQIVAGTGGAASVFTTIVAGPLKEAVYNIKIGNGGVGGAAGSHTAFGSGSPYHFRGGAVGKPKMSTEKEGDAGDWSVFGPGGDGGVPGQKGKDSPSLCAGGGGGSINSNGGKGGGGYLVVVPLPDFPRLTKLLPSLEALVAAGSPTDK